MRLQVLGSGTALHRPQRSSAALAVWPADQAAPLLVDLGSGALLRMAQAGIDFARVGQVLLTHLHPDHTGDLVPLLFAKRNPDLAANAALTISGGPGLNEFVAGLDGVYGGWIHGSGYQRTVREIAAGDSVDLPGCRARTSEVSHIPSSLAWRLDEPGGTSVVISGDTDHSHHLVDLARGVDLLVLECSFPDGQKVEGHLTPTECGRIAAAAGCGTLLLTHFYPGTDSHPLVECCRAGGYHGPIELAADLMQLAIGADGCSRLAPQEETP